MHAALRGSAPTGPRQRHRPGLDRNLQGGPDRARNPKEPRGHPWLASGSERGERSTARRAIASSTESAAARHRRCSGDRSRRSGSPHCARRGSSASSPSSAFLSSGACRPTPRRRRLPSRRNAGAILASTSRRARECNNAPRSNGRPRFSALVVSTSSVRRTSPTWSPLCMVRGSSRASCGKSCRRRRWSSITPASRPTPLVTGYT